MGVSEGSRMGDTSALEKQLNLKTKTIAELQDTLDQKSRFLFEQDDDLQNKERATYYMERTVEARSSELTQLNKDADALEPLTKTSGFAKAIDDGEAKVAAAEAAEAEIKAQVEECENRIKAAKLETEKYAAVMKRHDKGILSGGKIADEIQKVQQALAEDTGRLREEIAELNGDIEGVNQEADTVKKHSQFLEQWRVDAIFRQFTIKAKIRVITMKLKEMEC